jgi:hypothetical protein
MPRRSPRLPSSAQRASPPPHLSSSNGASAPFPSWNRSILTEIYLCHACYYHEIEDGNGAPGGGGGPRSGSRRRAASASRDATRPASARRGSAERRRRQVQAERVEHWLMTNIPLC